MPLSSPRFSVIVPVYNKASSLHTALESVFRQSYKDYEVIAIDDNSDDGSSEILHDYYRRDLVRLFRRSSPGPGGYAARNLGAAKARARWIVFLDADDVLETDHLALFAEAIDANPQLRMFVNGFGRIYEGKKYRTGPHLDGGIMDRAAALRAFSKIDFVHMNGACISRGDFLQHGGFPETRFRRGGDVYTWLRLICLLAPLHYSRQTTSYWVLDERGVTRDPANMDQVHPAALARENLNVRLSNEELRYLLRAANRKVLTWAFEKRLHGLPISQDLASLSIKAMDGKQIVKLLELCLPAFFSRAARGVQTTVSPHFRKKVIREP